jgi:hypothetical protein
MFLGIALLVAIYSLFYFKFPVFWIDADYFDYYSVADPWIKGEFGKYENIPFDLPLGIPLFIFFKAKLKFTLYEYIGIQILLVILGFALFSYSLIKYFKWKGGVASLMMALYLVNADSLYQITSTTPDALFLACILFLFSLLIPVLHGKFRPSNAILLTLFLFLPLLFRTNGIVVLIFLPMLLFFFRRHKWKLQLIGISSFFWAIFFLVGSKYMVGYFNYGNFKRYVHVYTNLKENKPSNFIPNSPTIKSKPNYLGPVIYYPGPYYFYSFGLPRPQFFYNQIPLRHKKQILRVPPYDFPFLRFDATKTVPEDWLQPELKNLNRICSDIDFNFKSPKPVNYFLKIYHLLYKLYSTVFASWVFIFIFYLVLLIFFYKRFLINFKSHSFHFFLIIYYLIMVLFLEFLAIADFPRYAFPQDFVPFLFLALLLPSPHAPQ